MIKLVLKTIKSDNEERYWCKLIKSYKKKLQKWTEKSVWYHTNCSVFCSLKKKVFLEAKKSKRCFFCNVKKDNVGVFKQKHKTAQFCFLWIKSTLCFFSLFSSDDKKDQHIFFFTSVFANSKNHHPLFRFISSKRRVGFKQRFAIPKHAYVFWELFTVLVAFFTHKMFALLCRGEMLSCDKTQFT